MNIIINDITIMYIYIKKHAPLFIDNYINIHLIIDNLYFKIIIL